MPEIPESIKAILDKRGFVEQGMTAGMWVLRAGDTEIAADLRGEKTVIGVLINGTVQEEGHGISRVQDFRNEILKAWENAKSGAGNRLAEGTKKEQGKKKEEDPAPQWKCSNCDKPVDGKQADSSASKYLRVLCQGCEPTDAEAIVYPPESGAKPPPVLARVHRPDAVLPVATVTPIGCMIKNFVPQLEEFGKIKIGEKGDKKTATGYSLPVKFDHFEITSILRDEQTGKFLPDSVMQALGENPRELDIMLLYNDISLNYRTRYNAYKGGKCVCAGDGETAITLDGDTVVCNPDVCDKFQKKECKLNGILSCILMKASRLGGVYKFRTTSHHTSRAILSSLMFISTLTGGTLAMIPLKLTISPKKVQPKDSKTALMIYVVNVIFPGTAPELLDTAVKMAEYRKERRIQIQQLEQTARLALTAPESEEEMKEVQDEYYPEQAQAAQEAK